MNELNFIGNATSGLFQGIFAGASDFAQTIADNQVKLINAQNKPQLSVIDNQKIQTRGLIDLNKLQNQVISEANTLRAEINLQKIKSAEALQQQTLLAELQRQKQRDSTATIMASKINQANNNNASKYIANIEQALIRGDANSSRQATIQHNVAQNSVVKANPDLQSPLSSKDILKNKIDPSAIKSAQSVSEQQAKAVGSFGTGIGVMGLGLIGLAGLLILKK